MEIRIRLIDEAGNGVQDWKVIPSAAGYWNCSDTSTTPDAGSTLDPYPTARPAVGVHWQALIDGTLVSYAKTTLAGEPPPAPTDLRLTDVTSSSVSLAWDDNSSNESLFEIQRTDDAGQTWGTPYGLDADRTAWEDWSVASDHDYRYRIRAANAASNSTWSNVVDAHTLGQVDPSAVDSYVGLGDSYSSGEGLELYEEGTNSEDNESHRSKWAYSSFVTTPGTQAPLRARQEAGEDVSWSFIACASARTDNVLPFSEEGTGQWNELPQLDQGLVNEATDLVVLTIGGNDADFASVLEKCFLSECTTDSFNGMPFPDWVRQNINGIYDEMAATSQAIRGRAPQALVAFLGYPKLMPDGTIERLACPSLGFYSHAEKDFLNEMAIELNDVISLAATSNGSSFVNVLDRFESHEICGDGGEWINGPNPSPSEDFFVDDQSFHPNIFGQQGYAAAVNEWLAGGVPSGVTETATAEEPNVFDAPGSLGLLEVNLELSSKESLGCRTVDGDLPMVLTAQGAGFAPHSSASVVLYSGGTPVFRSPVVNVSSRGTLSVSFPTSELSAGVSGIEIRGQDEVAGQRMLVRALRVPARCNELEETDSETQMRSQLRALMDQ